jgi:hypothetical protein
MFPMRARPQSPTFRTRQRAIRIVAAPLIALSACLIWIAVANSRLVSPKPENESVFLKTYTPKRVIDGFKAEAFSEMASGTSGEAGRGFATHAADFEPTFVIQTKDWVAVVQALRDDIASTLTTQNAQILGESGNPIDGFQIRYAVGKSEGRVWVEPVKTLATSLPFATAQSGSAKVTVHLRIHIDEKWLDS